MDVLEELAEQQRQKNKEEVTRLLSGDDRLLSALDMLFLIEEEAPSSDYIDGFTTALLITEKLKSVADRDRLNDLINAQRNLLVF